MLALVAISLGLLAVALVYWFIVRPILLTQPEFSAVFAREASMVDKWRAKVTGWKTHIAGRLFLIGAFVVGLYDQILPFVLGQDWTPVTAKMPSWSLPVGMTVVGFVISQLRKWTADPPLVITQKDEAGTPQVVAVLPPVK